MIKKEGKTFWVSSGKKLGCHSWVLRTWKLSLLYYICCCRLTFVVTVGLLQWMLKYYTDCCRAIIILAVTFLIDCYLSKLTVTVLYWLLPFYTANFKVLPNQNFY